MIQFSLNIFGRFGHGWYRLREWRRSPDVVVVVVVVVAVAVAVVVAVAVHAPHPFRL